MIDALRTGVWLSGPAWIALGWTLLHLSWIGAGIGLLAAVLRRLTHRARPETRQAIALGALLMLVLAPVVTFRLVFEPVPLAPAEGSPRQTLNPSRVMSATGDLVLPGAPSTPALSVRTTEPRASTADLTAWCAPLVPYLPALWLVGVTSMLGLTATGAVGVRRWRRASRLLDSGPIAEQCRALAKALGVSGRVGVAVCDRIAAPVLIGLVRPLILLPTSTLAGWAPDQIEMALLHELAHLRRHDHWLAVGLRLVESLLFFHPVTWWLTAWVRLESESCCDRLVVERTGQPVRYARLLAMLADSQTGSRGLAPAMAERPVLTRIRRILNTEVPRMRSTRTESLGLATAAGLVLILLTLAGRSGTAAPARDDEDREPLRAFLSQLGETVSSVPAGPALAERRDSARIAIARAQLAQGDPVGARNTLARLELRQAPWPSADAVKADPPGRENWYWRVIIAVRTLREAGDRAGARALLDRIPPLVETLNDAEARSLAEGVQAEVEMSRPGATEPERERARAVWEAVPLNYLLRIERFVLEERLAQGDGVGAQRSLRALHDRVASVLDRPARCQTLLSLGSQMEQAGDRAEGRRWIETALREAQEIQDPGLRALVDSQTVEVLAEVGALDEAIAVLQRQDASGRTSSLNSLLRLGVSFDESAPFLVIGSLKLTVGAPEVRAFQDDTAARARLARLVPVVAALEPLKVRARMLARVAHLQAIAGDFAGAVATAESIPPLRRSDDPGPADGFYDAVQPITFALIARRQAPLDLVGATASFRRAEALARAAEAEDQRLIAQTVIAKQYAAAGRKLSAQTLAAEAVAATLAQPEPRRSVLLNDLAMVQLQVGALDAARTTIDAIRAYPGLEKAHALYALARRLAEAGDAEGAAMAWRQAIVCLEADRPADAPAPGRVQTLDTFGLDTFIDPDLEWRPVRLVNLQRRSLLQAARAELGDAAALPDPARPLPDVRGEELIPTLSALVRRGETARALELIRAQELPADQLQALINLAMHIEQLPATAGAVD